MKTLLIVLAVLILLGLLRVGVHVVYDGEVKVQLLVWKFRISFPKDKKNKKTAPKPEKPAQPEREKAAKPAAKGWLQAALVHWQDILAFVGKALHMPRLDPLILHVTAGGPDPAEQALSYGRAWAVVGSVLPVLENTFRIGRRDVNVSCGEDQKEFSFYIETALTVRVYEILLLGVLGLKLLIQIYRTKSTQKAVQTT